MADDLKVRALIEILLKGKGAEEAKKALKDLQSEARRAQKSLKDAGKGAADGFDDASKKAKTLGEHVNQLARKFLGFAALIRIFRGIASATAEWANRTAEGREQLAKLSGQFQFIKDRIGEIGGRSLPFLTAALGGAVKAVQLLGAWWGLIIGGAVETVKGFADVVAAAFDFKRLVTQGPSEFLAGVSDAATRAVENIRFAVEGGVEEMTAIWRRGMHDNVDASAFWAEQQAKYDEEIAAGLEAIQERRRKAAEEAQRAAEKAAEEAKRLTERQADFELDAQQKLLAQQIEVTKEGSAERLAAELAALDFAFEREIAKAEANENAKTALRKAHDLARQVLQADFDEKAAERRLEAEKAVEEALLGIVQEEAQSRADSIEGIEKEARDRRFQSELELLELERQAALRNIQEILQAKIDAEGDPDQKAKLQQALNDLLLKTNKTYLDKRTALERGHAAIEAQIAKDLAAAKTQATLDATAQLFGALSALFHKSKAFAVAAAIMDTWAAVNRTLASLPYPANVIAAAAVAVQGLANVRRIVNAQPGGSAGGGGGGSVQVYTPPAQQSNATGTAKPGGQPTPLSGFDDPVSDMLAMRRGQKWAADFLRMTDRGFSRGLDESPVTNDHRSFDQRVDRSVTLEVRGPAVIDQKSLARFMRRARRAETIDRSRRAR